MNPLGDITQINAADEMRNAFIERQAQEKRAEAMRHLGQAIWDMIAAKHGPDFANAFTNALHAPTKPGTPERRFQDRCTEILPARLDKMTAEFRS